MNFDRIGFSETQKIILWVLATAACFIAMLAFDRSLPFYILWTHLTLFCFLFVFFKFKNSRNEYMSEAELNSTLPISQNYKVIIRSSKPVDDEPYYNGAPLFIFASNGAFSGIAGMFADIQKLKKLGEDLATFPKKTEDTYLYYTDYSSFQIKAYTIASTGRCGLQFEMDLNRKGLSKAYSVFSIVVYPAELAAFGHLLMGFAESQHSELQWSSELNATSEEWRVENDYLFSNICPS